MNQDEYNRAYEDGLRAAALIAERVRDALHQTGWTHHSAGAERVRSRIQAELDGRETSPRP